MENQTHPQNAGRLHRYRWLLLAVFAVILALSGIVLAKKTLIAMRNARATEIAPGFTLLDQHGRPTTLNQFSGKVVVLTFIDPECTDLCPLTTHEMVEALHLLGPAAAAQVQLLGIDANPQKTAVADVASYTRTHRLEGRWLFLTGPLATLENVWKDYHIFVAVEKDDVEHTADVFLIDGNGNLRQAIPTPMSYEAGGDQAHLIAQGVARLLPSHPAVAGTAATSPQPENPAADATIPMTALGPKAQPVVLGSAHAHLLVFFAGWLGQEPELSQHLAALDSYGALAQQQNWPAPVAVDELTTEPSPAEARQVLAPLAATLHTPIVQDASGHLADTYHVDDLPWYVLNSASGDILWRHDGWLTAAELNREVRAALAKK